MSKKDLKDDMYFSFSLNNITKKLECFAHLDSGMVGAVQLDITPDFGGDFSTFEMNKEQFDKFILFAELLKSHLTNKERNNKDGK